MTSCEKSVKLRNTMEAFNTMFLQVEADLEEAKNQYINFVLSNDVEGYLDLPYKMTKEWIGVAGKYATDASEFLLSNSFLGHAFSPYSVSYVYEYMEGADWVEIPVEYFDNPEKWESDLLARIAVDKIFVENAIVAKYGDVMEFTIKSITPICMTNSYENLLVKFFDPRLNLTQSMIYHRVENVLEGSTKEMKHSSMYCMLQNKCIKTI